MKLSPIATRLAFVRLLMGLAASTTGIHAFLFNGFTAYPALKALAKAQSNYQLSIRLSAGETKDARMFLDGLLVKLLPSPAGKAAVQLPGASGPHPQISTGAKHLQVEQAPHFIGMNGKTIVDLVKKSGCWEMVWRDNAASGQLICGFELAKDVARNQFAKLPAGHMYVTFPLFTHESLAEQQELRAAAEAKFREFRREKETKLDAFMSTDNLLMKAMHYRDAAKAHEGMDMTGFKSYERKIPTNVIPLEDGLLVGTKGEIHFKKKPVLGRPGPARSLVGEATLRRPETPQEEDSPLSSSTLRP